MESQQLSCCQKAELSIFDSPMKICRTPFEGRDETSIDKCLIGRKNHTVVPILSLVYDSSSLFHHRN